MVLGGGGGEGMVSTPAQLLLPDCKIALFCGVGLGGGVIMNCFILANSSLSGGGGWGGGGMISTHAQLNQPSLLCNEMGA